MRYPVNRFKEDWNITAGNSFGQQINANYWHEGTDINDNGGGNSDLGKEIFAISNGEMVYWHGAKHPTTGFGYHNVYKITGPWGTRWVHQAHNLSDLTPAPKSVSENEKIGRVGNSGTTHAHIHFSIFKVDPATLPNGIDTIAKTQQQLNDWWEDPIKFIEKYSQPADTLESLRKQRDDNWNLYQGEVAKLKALQGEFEALKGQFRDYKVSTDLEISNKATIILQLTERIKKIKDSVANG